jgi:2-polyprenyl-3-methyl-5-hydroxy-6-metoxy-1,4-benzoquinol methylase
VECKHANTSIVVRGLRDWELGVSGEFSYAECKECGLFVLKPFPSLEDLKRFYPDNYPAFQIGGEAKGAIYNFLHKLKSSALKKYIEKFARIRGAHVYDVGCGAGDLLAQFGKWGAAQLSGIDFSSVACAIANSKPGVKVEQGLFLESKIAPSTFDIAIMHHYIEHTIEPENELRRTFEILKPGGILLMELPNFAAWDRRLFGRYWGGNHTPRHTYQFTARTIVEFLKAAGFREVIVRHELNPAHFALSIQNLFQGFRHGNSPRGLEGGRAWYFSLLLILLVPLQAIATLCGAGGIITVVARK